MNRIAATLLLSSTLAACASQRVSSSSYTLGHDVVCAYGEYQASCADGVDTATLLEDRSLDHAVILQAQASSYVSVDVPATANAVVVRVRGTVRYTVRALRSNVRTVVDEGYASGDDAITTIALAPGAQRVVTFYSGAAGEAARLQRVALVHEAFDATRLIARR